MIRWEYNLSEANQNESQDFGESYLKRFAFFSTGCEVMKKKKM